MLREIRTIVIDSLDLEEAVSMLAVTRLAMAEFATQKIPAPAWLGDRIAELEREVKARRRDYLEKALRSAKLQRESFKTREERRADIDRDIINIENELGIISQPPAA